MSALRNHLVAVAALSGVALCGHIASMEIRTRLTHSFDLDLGLVLVAVVLAGPIAGVAVAVIPELIFLVRRREAIWRLWVVANWVSIGTTAVVGGLVLGACPATGPLDIGRICAAGVAMLLANYASARLILAVVRDGARPMELLRTEFVPLLPIELVAVGIGVVSAVLLPELGILALAGFALVIYLPQLAALQLLRAPSVAALDVDAAAAVYRDALADELRLGGTDRRLLHAVDALAQRRPLDDPPPNPLAAAKDALLVTICTSRAPTQRQFTASDRAQAVLVARAWAELTARCTPALNHHEALRELCGSSLAQDAPLAVAAAASIIEREHALTEHIAGVPRLHRTPLPRVVRCNLLPAAIARLTTA